jgi:hypothetical protein
LLNLPRRFSAAACLDFDLAVRDLMRWAEGRAHETKEVSAPKRKPRDVMHVPAYETIAELLGLDEDDTALGGKGSPSIDEAARELLRGQVDWRTFGVS